MDKFLVGIFAIFLFAGVFGAAIMVMWNSTIAVMWGMPEMNWWQATVLWAFCRLLFGGPNDFPPPPGETKK